MQESEFDRFADEYRALHAANTRAAGEDPDFFAAYKVADVAARAPQARRILDFGCGVGNAVPWFRTYLPDAALTALDISRRSLEVAESRFPGQATFVPFDGRRLPFPDASFDVVFTACVFHHIAAEDHHPLLSEIRRCLVPGGRFVLFEHNPWNPLTVRAVDTCPFDEGAVLIPAPEMRRRIEAAGFVAPQRRFRLFFPGALRTLRPLERWLTAVPVGAQYSIDAFAPGT